MKKAAGARARAGDGGGAAVDEAQIIPFSAVTGEGRDDLASAIAELVAQPAWREPAPSPADDDAAPRTEDESPGR